MVDDRQQDLEIAFAVCRARPFEIEHGRPVPDVDRGRTAWKAVLLKAFGVRACEQGIRLRYARCVDLFDDLQDDFEDHDPATIQRIVRSSSTGAADR